jgi:hypothetical protein
MEGICQLDLADHTNEMAKLNRIDELPMPWRYDQADFADSPLGRSRHNHKSRPASKLPE